jgi:hypothetical protein
MELTIAPKKPQLLWRENNLGNQNMGVGVHCGGSSGKKPKYF